ncbi:pyrimidine reductase family protein [Catenulispora rubra]|uniref:pyrimidine reductase family protein n=1 Tax=Catenulispora rubra TaxID=280293 RepID=UPI0018922A94|nr:pyrimidine reductase family protein [Catenulispora rubra]
MYQLLPPSHRSRQVDLAEVYAYPTGARRWVRANMVATVDGAATASGKSEGISGEADKRIFGVLRALADVVLVGAGTVRTEQYRPARVREQYQEARAAAGQAPTAAVAVVSRALDLDWSMPLFTSPAVPTIVLTATDAPQDRIDAASEAGADVIAAGTGDVDLALAVDRLAERGLGRILCEGGPNLLGQLAASGKLDELCLSIAPQLRGGDAMRVLAGPDLTDGLPLILHSLLTEDGFLFSRYLIGGTHSSVDGPGKEG